MDPGVGMEALQKKKSPLPGLEPRTVQAAAYSLYRNRHRRSTTNKGETTEFIPFNRPHLELSSVHITETITTPILLAKLVAEHLLNTERCCGVSETGERKRKMRSLEKDKLSGS